MKNLRAPFLLNIYHILDKRSPFKSLANNVE